MKSKTRKEGTDYLKDIMIAVNNKDQSTFNKVMDVIHNENLGNEPVTLFKLFSFLAEIQTPLDGERFKKMEQEWAQQKSISLIKKMLDCKESEDTKGYAKYWKEFQRFRKIEIDAEKVFALCNEKRN